MAEYIDREAAQKQFDHELYMTESEKAYTKSIIRKVPAADVAPVVHGRWEHLDRDIYNCTNCGGIHCVETCMGAPKWNYCPHCGAKMDGGE